MPVNAVVPTSQTGKKHKRVTLTLLPEDWDRFEEMGSANGMATAALIRPAMKEFLDRRRNGRLLAVKLDSRKEE